MPDKRILVVENDESERERVTRALAGYDCALAGDRSTLAQRLTSDHFDCIVLDDALPEATARELLPEIHKYQPNAAVIVLTGPGDQHSAGALVSLARDEIDPGRLAQAIHDATALHEARLDAERALRVATSKLSALGAHTTQILAARSAQEIAVTTADVALSLLDADAARVVIASPAVDHTRARDGRARPSRASTGMRVTDGRVERTRAIAGSRGERLGQLTTVSDKDEETEPLRDALLAQLCQIVAAALDHAALLALREDISSVVSHDLRAPLNNMALALGLLDHAEPRVRESLAFNVAHLARLVDDLVDLARMEHGRLPLVRGEHGLRAIAERVLRSFATQAKTRQITLRLEATTDPIVSCDEHRIMQALSSLVSRALHVSPAKSTVLLRVSNDDGALIEVIDSGPEIKDADRAHVFSRERSRQARDRGHGLGLFIAKAIVVAHGGEIGFDREPLRGTRFWIELPHETR